MPSTPSDEEQLLLELINRFRADPDGESGRLTGAEVPPGVLSAMNFFGVTLSALEAQLAAFGSVAPLAWNGNLADAADGHNQAMIDADAQTHQAPGEPGLGQRATDAGYANWSALGENVYAFSSSAAYGHAGFVIDWGYDDEDFNGAQLFPDWQTRGDGMQDPPGHRNSLMSASFTEIGISVVAESDPGTDVGPQLITQDLGNRFNYEAQFVGVVINDADGDDFYDIGEGLSGVSVLLERQGGGSYNTSTWASGGWQAVVPAGTYTITFSGGGLTSPIVELAVIGSVNVKVDAIATIGGGSTTPTQGPDALTGTAGADSINGLGGNDIIFGLGGDDRLVGGGGADHIEGGLGDDLYFVDAAGDAVIESAAEGIDQVRASIDYTLVANVEELILVGGAREGTGNELENTIFGAGGADTLTGMSGDDILRGKNARDELLGGDGQDLLDGGQGKDTMTGGSARDVFQFRDGDFGGTRSVADVITDFSQADNEKISLNLVDANTTAGGNQAFSWLGTGAFTGVAGQLHYVHQGGNTYVEGDLDGDGVADVFIALTGTINLAAGDFVL